MRSAHRVRAAPAGMALAERSGLRQGDLLEVLGLGAMASPMISLKGPAIMQRAYPPAFKLVSQQKDMRLVLALGCARREGRGSAKRGAAPRAAGNLAVPLGQAAARWGGRQARSKTTRAPLRCCARRLAATRWTSPCPLWRPQMSNSRRPRPWAWGRATFRPSTRPRPAPRPPAPTAPRDPAGGLLAISLSSSGLSGERFEGVGWHLASREQGLQG